MFEARIEEMLVQVSETDTIPYPWKQNGVRNEYAVRMKICDSFTRLLCTFLRNRVSINGAVLSERIYKN